MVKRKPLGAITAAANRPIAGKTGNKEKQESTANRKRSTVNRKPKEGGKSWEERNTRHTFHVNVELLEHFKRHAEKKGKSLARLHDQAMRELLEREEETSR